MFHFNVTVAEAKGGQLYHGYGREELNFANPERLLSIRGVDSKCVQSENVATRKGF